MLTSGCQCAVVLDGVHGRLLPDIEALALEDVHILKSYEAIGKKDCKDCINERTVPAE